MIHTLNRGLRLVDAVYVSNEVAPHGLPTVRIGKGIE
jgi:hypothetical protein